MTDTIADMLTRIRNGYTAKHKQVDIPHSKVKLALAEKLVQLGYLQAVETDDSGDFQVIRVKLKYKGDFPVVSGLRRYSKPGRRMYAKSSNIPKVLAGYGSTIISTSKGILSDTEAREKGVGGELICQVW